MLSAACRTAEEHVKKKKGSHPAYWIAALVLAGVGVALFVLPHHKGDFDFGSLARDFGELVNEDKSDGGPAVFVWVALVGLGCLAVFLPAIQAAALALVSPESSRSALIVGGVLLVLASPLTLLAEVISDMMIGWGNSSRFKAETLVAYLAPLFPFLCGVASIVMGTRRVRRR